VAECRFAQRGRNPPVSLQFSAFSAAIYLHAVRIRRFIYLPLPSPYIGAAGGLLQSQVLCYWLPLPSWGRMSGLACNRRPLARALLGRAPFRTAWHNDLSTMNWGMGKDGNRTSWGRGYVFTRVGHSSQPPTGGHLRSRVSSINFTSTLSKRLMRRISPLQSVPKTLPLSHLGQNRGNYLCAWRSRSEG
jgi:hypothetical protein